MTGPIPEGQEGTDKRRYARVQVRDGVHVACEGLVPKFRGLVRAISPRGLFIQTTHTFARGSRLLIRIRLDDEVLDAECLVRDVEPQGIGVEFLPLTDDQQESLARLTLKIPT